MIARRARPPTCIAPCNGHLPAALHCCFFAAAELKAAAGLLYL